ncbi:MAG: hypothetical protein HQL76_06855 [Magnetococcales bacterium]|nr:hypothetical protein [Magnetococcales bacterium]
MNIHRFSLALLLGKVRRFLVVRFRPNTLARMAALRQGGCNRCAVCCQLLYRCPMLSKNNLCMIYHSPLRPTVCQHFPLDDRDLRDVARQGLGSGCSYVFAERVEELPFGERNHPELCSRHGPSLKTLKPIATELMRRISP